MHQLADGLAEASKPSPLDLRNESAILQVGRLQKLKHAGVGEGSLMGQIDVPKIGAEEIGGIGHPTTEKASGLERAARRSHPFQHQVFAGDVFQNVVAEDGVEGSRSFPQEGNAILKVDVEIGQAFLGDCDLRGRGIDG